MGLFSNCIIACDIDGTLLINGYLNPRNIEKINYFINEGGHFSLSTGRTVGAVSCVLEKIKDISPSVVANGCMIYDFKNERILYETCIPESDYKFAKLVYDTGLNVGIEVHSGRDIITLNRTKETDDHQRYESLNSMFLTFDEAEKYKWNKVVYLFDNLDDLATVKSIISKEKANTYFVDTSATLFGVKRNYYEQVPVNVSKSSSVDKLCDFLKIKKGCKFAIGDYYNDLEMIKHSDIGAAPVDSPEDIKEYADFITVPCKDGAVADFIDYLTANKNKFIGV